MALSATDANLPRTMAAMVGLLIATVPMPGAGLAHAATPSQPGSPGAGFGSEAVTQCERAVRQALAPKSGPAEFRLVTASATPHPPSEDDLVLLHGEGQWRDTGTVHKFSYRCSLDVRGGEAVGVVIRHASARPTEPTEPSPFAEPDLSHLSPAACESGAAAALQRRWPRVSKITFDTTTRRLSQQSVSRADLHGQGRAQPAPESPVLVHFGFDCTIDPRDGRVVEVRLGG